MRILKIKGKDEATVTTQVKKEYGEDVVIISKYQEKEGGLFGFLKKSQYVMTIAVEEPEPIEELEAPQTMVPKFNNYGNDIGKDSYKLLLSLKDQVADIKKDIDDVKVVATSTIRQPIIQISKESHLNESHLKEIVQSCLQEEGVDKEVIDYLLDSIEETDDTESLVRRLYENIAAMIKQPILDEEPPKAIFFIGSTGVGKTTTIAKLTADYVLNKNKSIALFTADTYRIAAIEQLKTYADIVGVPIEIIYSEDELTKYLEKWQQADHIFIDTAGRSHKNLEQIQDMKKILNAVDEKKVFLVVNVNTSYKDIKNIIDTYRAIVPEFHIIVTKLDETDNRGNLLNIAYYAKVPIAYITHGQNVPEDFSAFDINSYIKELLGRISYE